MEKYIVVIYKCWTKIPGEMFNDHLTNVQNKLAEGEVLKWDKNNTHKKFVVLANVTTEDIEQVKPLFRSTFGSKAINFIGIPLKHKS